MTKALKTLIVDDHDGMRATLEDILVDEGHNVKLASSGFEAIDSCKNNQFDYILMDVMMPGINGVDTFKKIKEITSKTRVIMMSAYSGDNFKMEALKEGAIAYLQKPLDVSEVLHILDETKFTPTLVITKDTVACENILTTLKGKPFYPHVTHSTEEAMVLAKHNNFGLMLIDTDLGPISGLDLHLALKHLAPEAAVIMIAAGENSYREQAKVAIEHNAYSLIEKPIQQNEFEVLLNEVTSRQMRPV